mmetsp:Transcript_70433/g.199734  ORF Transcript_70433/g.199734 Transcript_70433/m.199734 type:complete len:283 (-) Transcript_70433:176-1024(-)
MRRGRGRSAQKNLGLLAGLRAAPQLCPASAAVDAQRAELLEGPEHGPLRVHRVRQGRGAAHLRRGVRVVALVRQLGVLLHERLPGGVLKLDVVPVVVAAAAVAVPPAELLEAEDVHGLTKVEGHDDANVAAGGPVLDVAALSRPAQECSPEGVNAVGPPVVHGAHDLLVTALDVGVVVPMQYDLVALPPYVVVEQQPDARLGADVLLVAARGGEVEADHQVVAVNELAGARPEQQAAVGDDRAPLGAPLAGGQAEPVVDGPHGQQLGVQAVSPPHKHLVVLR